MAANCAGRGFLWVHKSTDHFVAPLMPGGKDLFTWSLGGFNLPGLHAFALEPAGAKRRAMLIKFCHGLGGAVQFTVVLQHLAKAYPD